jgi:2-polyprenyl-3-methyl-5-hydroxy-6-metoxy-1,4-benzoquinol methylase
MRAKGCKTIGMDFSEHSLRIARSSGHLALPADETGWSQIAQGSVDFVRMNHVLEHLYEPAQVLRRLRARMAPGAVLHIAVPNPDGLSARLYGRYWFGLDCPRHVIFFPLHTLRAWLEHLGFSILEVITEPAAKDFIRSQALQARHRYGMEYGDLDQLGRREDLRGKAALPVLFARLIGLPDRFHVFAARPAT